MIFLYFLWLTLQMWAHVVGLGLFEHISSLLEPISSLLEPISSLPEVYLDRNLIIISRILLGKGTFELGWLYPQTSTHKGLLAIQILFPSFRRPILNNN